MAVCLFLVFVAGPLLVVLWLWPRHLQRQAREEAKKVPDAHPEEHPYDSGPTSV